MNEKFEAIRACGITNVKIDKVYDLVQKFKAVEAVSRALIIKPNLLSNWIDRGTALLDEYPDLGSELSDCYLVAMDAVEEAIENQREELKDNWLMESNQTEINHKNQNAFEAMIQHEKETALEVFAKQAENELVDDYKFGKPPIETDNIKKYIKFSRAYTRGKNAMMGNYVGNIDKHAGTSKNAALSYKMLEATEDSFKPQKLQMEHKLSGGSYNLVDMMRNFMENKQKQGEAIEQTKLIEGKVIDIE